MAGHRKERDLESGYEASDESLKWLDTAQIPALATLTAVGAWKEGGDRCVGWEGT